MVSKVDLRDNMVKKSCRIIALHDILRIECGKNE